MHLLPLVLLHFVIFVNQLDAHLFEHLLGLGAVVVAAFAYHADDAAVDDEHGAGAARSHATIEGGAVEGDAEFGGLADGVLLGVDGTHAVLGEAAVNILVAMDDQVVIDVLRKVEEMAKANGSSSMGSYWLSLMPSDRAAEIQRKMISKPESLE